MEKEKKDKSGISGWAEADRPREKLILHGRRTLSDAELIAILIRAGNRTESAVGVSKRILKSYANDLTIISKLNVSDLSKFHGMGMAKAITIIAALELGRRRKDVVPNKSKKINSSKDADQVIRPELLDLTHEELLNRANTVIGKHFISKGGQSGTVVDPKIIFKIALEQNASSVILAHNHPSGNLKASQADLNVTRKLVEAGHMLELPVIDHLIITDNAFMSFADEGLM